MPIYTYRCPQGHEWDEYRTLTAGTEVAEGSCSSCPLSEEGLGAPGLKVPARVSVAFRGRGWTPKFYSNREGK